MKIIRQLSEAYNLMLRHGQMRRLIWIFFAVLALSISMLAESVTGFVTSIDSPTEIEIGTMHVRITSGTRCSFDMQSGNARPKHPTLTSPCNLSQMTIGSRVKLAGQFTNTEQFVASKCELSQGFHLRESRLLLMYHRPARGILIREALNEEAPVIKRSAEGWNGIWWIDGYPMNINSQTRLLLSTDSELAGEGRLTVNAFPIHANSYYKDVRELDSRDLLAPNTWTIYHAKHEHDGAVAANQVRLWLNQVSYDEKKNLAKYAAKIRQPDYGRSIPGSIQYAHRSPIEIVPNLEIQEYISYLGMNVVPKYQKDMTASNPTKVNFRFYVIRPFVYEPHFHFLSIDGDLPGYSSPFRYKAPRSYSETTSVMSVSNGIVLVPDVVLAHMQSQSQVTALLSYAITSILQKQAEITCAGDIPDCFRNEAEQLLRIGIRQMCLAGYDIREAPYAWAVAQGKPVHNPIINSKHPDQEIPWYAAYAFNYMSQYYKDVDYSKLKRGEKEYQQFLVKLRKADPEAFAPTSPKHARK